MRATGGRLRCTPDLTAVRGGASFALRARDVRARRDSSAGAARAGSRAIGAARPRAADP
jgi:hypothetical protein